MAKSEINVLLPCPRPNRPWHQGWSPERPAPGRGPRTSARGCRDADADEVLEGDDAGQEATVLGPDLCDGLSSAPVQDSNQPAGVNHGIEIHSLANYVN